MASQASTHGDQPTNPLDPPTNEPGFFARAADGASYEVMRFGPPEEGDEDDGWEPGWYWQFCVPGGVPTSDTKGPFNTFAEARRDADPDWKGGVVENHKLAVLSTANLRPATAQSMENYPRGFPFIVAPFEEGFFVSCASVGQVPDAEGVPQDLLACRRWAADNGYRYILFDRDAESAVDGVADYSEEWE